MKQELDYIIVGQGLAGSALAQYLIRKKRSILVLGSPDYKRTSEVAAGLYNPVTGKKMVLTWNADVLFPQLNMFYKDAEELLGEVFMHPKTIYRPFTDIQSQNDFWVKSGGNIIKYTNPDINHSVYEPYIHNDFGGISTKCSGYVDVKSYINSMKKLLITHGDYREENFDYAELKIEHEKVYYKDCSAKKIIFAEGYYNRLNPYFNWLPVNGMKGDVLTLNIDDYPLQDIINKHYFIIPLANGSFRMGSSYIREFEDDKPTEIGLKELTEGALKILKKSICVIDHRAGIRPVVPDHRPIVGLHPQFPSLLVLNGLGTKGVSLVPFASKALIDFIEDKQEIDESISVNRFYYLYFKQKRIPV